MPSEPVMTTLRMSGLLSATPSASTPAAYITGSMALRRSGLRRVRIRVCPWLVLWSSAGMAVLGEVAVVLADQASSTWLKLRPMAPRRRSQGLGR